MYSIVMPGSWSILHVLIRILHIIGLYKQIKKSQKVKTKKKNTENYLQNITILWRFSFLNFNFFYCFVNVRVGPFIDFRTVDGIGGGLHIRRAKLNCFYKTKKIKHIFRRTTKTCCVRFKIFISTFWSHGEARRGFRCCVHTLKTWHIKHIRKHKKYFVTFMLLLFFLKFIFESFLCY